MMTKTTTMKKLLLSCLTMHAFFAFGQVIPNSFFEGWNSKTTELPKTWEIYGKGSKVSGKTSGNALRLTNNAVTGLASYAFQSKTDTNSSLFYSSAFAFAGTPDSVVITYRAGLQADTTYLQLSFTKNGESFPVTLDELEISGNSGLWKTVTFPVSYVNPTDSLIADSGWIFIQSADDVDGPYSNGYIEFDNITFIYKNHTTVSAVPNENFEEWTNYTLESPDGWATPALFLKNANQNISYTNKSSDKYTGNYALKLQGFVYSDPITLKKDTFTGMAITMKDASNPDFSNANINKPGFKVTQRYQSIRGYFKSNLYLADQVVIMVNFFKADSIVGSAVLTDKTSHNTWTPFTEDIAWDSTFKGTPDSASIALMVSDSTFSTVGSLNSWAIFDDLKFDNYSASSDAIRVSDLNATVFPNPTQGYFHIQFDAEKNDNCVIVMRNMQGQTVYRSQNQINKGNALIPVDISTLSAGIYTLVLQTADGIFTAKIALNP